MEYSRQNNLIRAGLAENAWRLLKHYEQLTKDVPPRQRYEATLTISLLQLLFTNCWELYKSINRDGPELAGALNPFIESLLANSEVDVTDTFPREAKDARRVVEHVRNAVSHPRMKEAHPPTTGYTTVEDGSGLIVRIRFTDSPDLNVKGNPRREATERIGWNPEEVQIFTIELPLSRLTALTEEIALVLAQPVMGNWDSRDLVPLPL